MRGEEDEGYRGRKEGSVRCSEVGTELKSKESSVTVLLGGLWICFFMELCYSWLT